MPTTKGKGITRVALHPYYKNDFRVLICNNLLNMITRLVHQVKQGSKVATYEEYWIS